MTNGLPPGWSRPASSSRIICHKQVDSYIWLEIRFDGETNKYVVEEVDHDGGPTAIRHGAHEDIGKALSQAEHL